MNGPSSIKAIEQTYNSKVFKYFLVVGMSRWSHILLNVLYRSSFPRVTFCLWAATLYWPLVWAGHAQIIGPTVFAGIHFWLPNGLVFVHVEVVVAENVLRPKFANCLVCHTRRGSQQALLVHHANHVPARLLVHHNVIATLLLVKQDFMLPAVGCSHVPHVVDSSAA